MGTTAGLLGLATRGDLRFVADMARRGIGDLRGGRDRSVSEGESALVLSLATGTFETMAWLLDLTDVTPAHGAVSTDRSVGAVVAQRAEAARLRDELDEGSLQAMYLHGVVDALCFALGEVEGLRLWWTPLGQDWRTLDGVTRDEYGRAI
ncbi:MAG: hypothetical protein ACRCYU_04220 [Nocardioides sp.]